jgi:multidrug resistance efflux pump
MDRPRNTRPSSAGAALGPGLGLGLGLIVLALGAGCGAEGTEKAISFAVKKGDLVFARSFYGELVARKSIAIHTPELTGIYQLTVEALEPDGTKIKKGDVVLTFATGVIQGELTDQEAQLGVGKAEMRRLVSDLAREKIELTLAVKRARLDVQRAKLNVIAGVNLISKVELDKAKIGLSQAKLALKLAQKALKTFAKKRAAALEVQRLKVAAIEEKAKEKRQQIASAKLRSPADGVLYAPYTRLNWVRGKAAPGSVTRPGDKILEIPDLSAFDVALYVRQRDATLLSVGDEAVVLPTVLPDQPIKAKVVSKESFAATRNERLGTRESQGNLKEVKVLLRLERNFKQLRPGGTVRADVRSVIAKDVLMVPLLALEEASGASGGGYRARLASGRTVKVTLGKVSSTHAEIKSGLSAGDRVLLPARAERRGAAAKGKGKGKAKRGKRPGGKGRKARKGRGAGKRGR